MKNKYFRTARLIIVFMLYFMLFCSSCTVGRYEIKADSLQQPVSMTPVILLKNGSYYEPRDDEKVHHFVFKKRHWWFLYAVPLTTAHYDFSQDIKNTVKDNNGNAVVNLKVHAQTDWYMMFSALIPLIPDYMLVTVEGDVVAMKE